MMLSYYTNEGVGTLIVDAVVCSGFKQHCNRSA